MKLWKVPTKDVYINPDRIVSIESSPTALEGTTITIYEGSVCRYFVIAVPLNTVVLSLDPDIR
jgi:hypothetical protein